MQRKNNRIAFDLNALVMFARVVECHSFTQAALELEVTKSTISRKVAELEKYLGIRLLTRSTRSLLLTKEGTDFYHSCTQVIDLIEETEVKVMASQELIRGEISIVMPIEVGHGVLGECMVEFMKLYPDVIIHLELLNRKVDIISEGFDLSVQVGEITDSSLISRTIHQTTRVLVASPEYLKEYGTPRSLSDLRAPHQQIKHTSMTALMGANILTGLPYRFKGNTLTSLLSACLDGLGITYIPEYLCKEHIKAGRLVHILPDLDSVKVPLSFVYPERKLMPKRLRAFIDFTVCRFAEKLSERQQHDS